MYEFERLKPGMKVGWKPIRLADGKLHAIIICPKCGEEVFLGNNEQGLHHINDDGMVNPSVLHETREFIMHVKMACGAQCGWHDIIKLVGWKP